MLTSTILKSRISCFSIIISFFFCTTIFSQEEELMYKDHVYVNFIKSIKFHHRGLVTSMPIVDLKSSGILSLSFDDLEGGSKTYIYEIIHCDRNWEPSDLNTSEYLDGFNGEDIENIDYSVGTFHDYSHYVLTLPNRDINWLKSGNYILAVYEDEYDKILVFTRRFMVVEPRVTIVNKFRPPTNVSKIRTHQEIGFHIDFSEFRIVNPLNEIEVAILQNGRWDNAMTGLHPKFISGTKLSFDYVDKLNFPALNEFRYADLRSTKFLSEGVHSIDVHKNGIDVLLKMDRPRTFTNYHTYDDLNGEYIIETLDDNNDQLEAEYVNAIFTLDAPAELSLSDVYLMGKFTDWEIHDDFKMEFDPRRNIFYADIELKQGYYDYQYVAVRNGIPSSDVLEGSWFETENTYTILVYFSEFGARYDRLIAAKTISSVD